MEKIFILGGCRSGKSKYAEEWVRTRYSNRCFIATLETRGDLEMEQRVRLHQQSRGDGWQTVEAPFEVVDALQSKQDEVDIFLVDCITLWITNLMLRGLSDTNIELEVHKLVDFISGLRSSIVFVANEVGLGVVPDNAMARRFRDLAGWTNQQLAVACDKVLFMAAGLPLLLKG